MDLQLRKYNLIQEIFGIEKESSLDALEKTLKQVIESDYEISQGQKKVLHQRLKNYEENPDDLLDWEKVKNDW